MAFDRDEALDEVLVLFSEVAFVLKRRINTVFSMHVFAMHLNEKQSAFLLQRMPTVHLVRQLPPQSTSVSTPSLNLFAQLIWLPEVLNLDTVDLG